jgi:hypothetical protein
MNKLIPIVLLLLVAGGVGWFALNHARSRPDPQLEEFQTDAENLITGLQQYKEFVGEYPKGSQVEISRALSGQTEKKVLILATGKNKKNAKGEIIDPWGMPLQFYFAHNGVMIRSAGPNKVFEDSKTRGTDDLYRTETK